MRWGESMIPDLLPVPAHAALDADRDRGALETWCGVPEARRGAPGIRTGAEVWPDVLAWRARFWGAVFRADASDTAHDARALITAVVSGWYLHALVDDAVLCTSELVGNAVRHASCPYADAPAARWISVGVRWEDSGCVSVEVGDDDPRPPRPAPPGDDIDDIDELALCGRGLGIVEGVADHLWWERAGRGKVVRCRFSLARYGLRTRWGAE